LEASYEATFHSAIINFEKTGNNILYLTLLGGGAFRNNISWIVDAIKRSLHIFRNYGLDVKIVSRKDINLPIENMIKEFL